MPFRPARLRFVSVAAIAVTLALIGGGAAVAQRAGVLNIPFTGDGARASAANEEPPAEDTATPEPEDETPPASGVETSSTGESPPSVEAVIDGPEGSGGWYTGDVSLTWTVADEETPDVTTEGCEDATVTEDTTGATFTCTATSEGGTTTATATIARDATGPADVSVTADPAASNGWHTAPFTATWTGNDATSGIAACTETTYEGPDARDASLDGVCTDRAGNRSDTVAYEFSYDATAPAVTAVPDRDPDHDGWYNKPLSVSWRSDDPNATCDPATDYAGPDTEDATVSGGCTDEAGNRGTASYTFDYDATAPVVIIESPSAGSYVLNQPVTVRVSCSDATAGVGACESSPRNGTAADTSSVGPKSVTATATDRAGNRATARHDYTVTYSPAGVKCAGVAGHQILEPIAADGSTTAKRNSTVPAKFRVCDYNGKPVTGPGVVTTFRIVAVDGQAADGPVPSTNAHEQFRSGDSQWIYNISTKSFRAGSRYAFRIGLNDGTSIEFSFRVR